MGVLHGGSGGESVTLQRSATTLEKEPVDLSKAQTDYHDRRATTVYGSEEIKNQYVAEHRNSKGQPIDYILVSELPGEAMQEELHNAAIEPYKDGDSKAVKHWRKRECFLQRLRDRGLTIEPEVRELYDHGSKKEDSVALVFYKISAPFHVLCNLAEKAQMPMPLANSSKKVRKSLFHRLVRKTAEATPGEGASCCGGFREPDVDQPDNLHCAPFQTRSKEKYHGINNEEDFFSDAQRSLLVNGVLDRAPYYHKHIDTRGIGTLLKKGVFIAAYPLHDGPLKNSKAAVSQSMQMRPMREQLFRQWALLRTFHLNQPIRAIRAYFGEKIAFYFAWAGFYTEALKLPAIFGIATMGYGLYLYANTTEDATDVCKNNQTMCPVCETCEPYKLSTACDMYRVSLIFDNATTIAFSIFMAVWSTIFVDTWKRRQARLAFEWDVRDFHLSEPHRADFRGTQVRTDPVTDKKVTYYPKKSRLWRYAVSIMTLLSMVAVVLMAVVGVIVYRLALNRALTSNSVDASGIGQAQNFIVPLTAAVINLAVILVLDVVYSRLAVVLTDWENHETQSKYETHMAWKMFLFQFVNSYSSLFYIAFFKGRFSRSQSGTVDAQLFGYKLDACPAYGCFLDLSIQLAVIQGGRLLANNLKEFVVPIFKTWWRSRHVNRRAVKNNVTPWDKQLMLEKVGADAMFKEYLELVVQYGFATLFAPAFPLSPLATYLNNVLEIRIDASKLIRTKQRPPALRARSIGIWGGVISVISLLSVAINGLNIAFSSSWIEKQVYEYKFGSLSGYIDYITPAVPGEGCHTISVREGDGSESLFYWHVLAARLAFLVAFEHFVFFIKILIGVAITDVPKDVRDSIARTEYQQRHALEAHLFEDEEIVEEIVIASRPSHHHLSMA